jgi:uncharacterized GH25 family protein
MKFKLLIASILLIFVGQNISQAHYMWIETAQVGKIGKEQSVNVYFGEYNYDLLEKTNGDHFKAVEKFTLWSIAPSGTKTQIATTKSESSYVGTFTPSENGVYLIVLNNNEIDVIDYTQYDFGIFKTHYHSTAKVLVGKESTASATELNTGLRLDNLNIKLAKGDLNQMKVSFDGKPLADTEVGIFLMDQWSKKDNTDEMGMVGFKIPFSTKYIIEVTKKEEVPGSFNGKEYQFIWHCTTYCIDLNSN